MDATVGGDFEAPGLWDEYRTTRIGDFVHGGAWSERMRSVRIFGVPDVAELTQVSTRLTGEVYTPRLWLRPGTDNTASLWIVGSSTPGGPIDTYYEELQLAGFPSGVWTEYVGAAIALPCDGPRLGLQLLFPDVGQSTSTVHVDDLVFAGTGGDVLAVMGIELPLRALLATLQASLNTELTHIGSERADGLTPHSIENWYCWKREDLAVNRALVEVYERGGTVFPDWKAQVSTWVVGQRVPLRSEHPLVVAVVFANRGLTPSSRTLKMSEMRILAMRYAAGVVRTVRNTPNLGQGDLLFAEPGEASITYGLDEPDGPPASMRVEIPFTVRVSESSSGETTPGGGTPPSANLEG